MHVAGVARWSRFAHLLLCTHRHKLALCRVQRRSIELDIECVGVPHVIALGIKESHLREGEKEKASEGRERERGELLNIVVLMPPSLSVTANLHASLRSP